MTVPSNKTREDYVGDGATTEWDYTFKIFNDSELVVIYTDDENIDHELVLNTDYTVTEAGHPDGGKVKLQSGGTLTSDTLTSSEKLSILRSLPVTQLVDLRNQRAFFADTHEDVFDRLTILIQQELEQGDRSVRLPQSINSDDVATDLPKPVGGRAIGWNSAGDALVNLEDLPADAQSGSKEDQVLQWNPSTEQYEARDIPFDYAVDSVSALRAGSYPSSLDRIWLSGYYGVGTAGGGPLYRDSSDTTTTDNGGTVFVDADGVRWKRPDLGVDPEHVTDSGTDAYVSDVHTTDQVDGHVIFRDFQSANTTTMPTLDGLTITTKDGSALWEGALSGEHTLQLASDGNSWLVLDPNPVSTDDANATVKRDSSGRAKFSDPSAPQDAATKSYVETQVSGISSTKTVINRIRSTNRIQNPTFVQGWSGWGNGGNGDGRNYIGPEDPGGSPFEQFGNRRAQLSTDSDSGVARIITDRTQIVDASKPHVIGMWGGHNDDGGTAATGDIILRLHCYDSGGTPLSTVDVTRTLPVRTSLDGQTGELYALINNEGGTAPAFPAGTVAVTLDFRYEDNTATADVLDAFIIPEDELATTGDTVSRTNHGSFGGTHEAVTDGTHLYACAHPNDEVAKFDANMVRQSTVAVATRPHDVALLDGSLWVICNGSADLYEVDPANMSVLNNYALDGARVGFDVEAFGSRLFISIGDASQTAEILEVDPSTGGQSSVTTDVDGGNANIPIVFADGSLWSINSPDVNTSQVKRINPDTGATDATIAAGIKKIYGLGTDGTYVYANGTTGVVKIDPSTDSVVQTYPFRKGFGGATNMEFHDGLMWGGQRGVGVFYVDPSSDRIVEWVEVAGAPKFVREFNGNLICGYAYGPWLDVFEAK